MSIHAGNLISVIVNNPDQLNYAFQDDHSVDADLRYLRDDIITSSVPKSEDPSKSTFAMLSSELHGKQYQIRTAEQQAQWTQKKSICQQHLATEVLKFKSTWVLLTQACDGRTEHLLGHIKTDEMGTKICYDLKLHEQVKQLAFDYLNDESEYDIDELIELIVKDYNLSYCHFVKDAADKIIKKFELAEKSKKDYINSKNNEKTIQNDLFDDCDDVVNFENDEAVNWDIARTTILLCKTLTMRICQLRNLLVGTNLRGCLKHAINYYFSGGGSRQSSLDQMDLFSEGVEGLMHASDMYIHGTSAKFSTYAEYWIKLRISRYIKNNYTVKIPIHVNDLIGKVMRFFKERSADGSELFTPCKDEASKAIKENIPDPVWRLVLHRHNNTPYSISCVNNEGDDGAVRFDMFPEVEVDSDAQHNSVQVDQILAIAKKLINANPSKPMENLTQQQYDIFVMKHIDEKTNSEIAEKIGNNLNTKNIRKEADRAMEIIRHMLDIKVNNGDK